jgi:hypothetical protein
MNVECNYKISRLNSHSFKAVFIVLQKSKKCKHLEWGIIGYKMGIKNTQWNIKILGIVKILISLGNIRC